MKYISFISKQEEVQHCVNTNFSSMQICKIEAFYIGQLGNTLKTKRNVKSGTKSLQ